MPLHIDILFYRFIKTGIINWPDITLLVNTQLNLLTSEPSIPILIVNIWKKHQDAMFEESNNLWENNVAIGSLMGNESKKLCN